MDSLQSKAFHIAATTALAPHNGRWKVPSQTGQGSYDVAVNSDGAWHCTCPDHEERLADCKHIMAVEVTIQRETGTGGKPSYSETVKMTYSQNWKAYNAAQCNEKAMVLSLLADACSTISTPPQATGRPRLPMSDMAFAAVYRAYARCSSRRFTTDLRDAQEGGLIEKAPAFNSVCRYVRDPAMGSVLAGLIELTSLPLCAVETDFAVDSSGFGATNMKTWFSQKHGREVRQREWRKVHAMAGVRTHIVTAVKVGSPNVNDSVMLPQLVTATAKHFELGEVSADKGYLTKSNAAHIEEAGATPFIPFKSNTVEPADGSPWARMYHLYAYRREDFLAHYHKRSNVETVFGMVKAKFGDTLLGKTETAQDNEVLAKFVAHNLCVLVQSFHELGIESDLSIAA